MDVTPSEIRAAMQNYDIGAAFAVQDRLPREWRELIYTHGQLKVLQLLLRGYDYQQATQLLNQKMRHHPPPATQSRRIDPYIFRGRS